MALQIFGTNGGGGTGGSGTDPNAVPKSTVTAKGDLIVGTGSGTVARKAAGADGKLVKYDSTTGTGLGDADAVALAQSGQTPSQAPSTAGTTDVGTSAVAARADHVHPSSGLFKEFGLSTTDVVFDGTSAVTGFSRAGTIYTANSGGPGPHIYRNMTVNAGVRVNINGWLYVTNTLTNNGTVSTRGGDATGAVAGATPGWAKTFTGGAGVAGTTGAGGAGAGPGSGQFRSSRVNILAGAGGAANGGSTAGGAAFNLSWDYLTTVITQVPSVMFTGHVMVQSFSGSIGGGASGGAGAGDGTNAGGASGAGGDGMVVNCRKLVGTGVFDSSGGNGGNATGGNAGGGGAGSPGPQIINTTDISLWSGTRLANVGTPGAGAGTGAAGTAGGGTLGDATQSRQLNVWS